MTLQLNIDRNIAEPSYFLIHKNQLHMTAARVRSSYPHPAAVPRDNRGRFDFASTKTTFTVDLVERRYLYFQIVRPSWELAKYRTSRGHLGIASYASIRPTRQTLPFPVNMHEDRTRVWYIACRRFVISNWSIGRYACLLTSRYGMPPRHKVYRGPKMCTYRKHFDSFVLMIVETLCP